MGSGSVPGALRNEAPPSSSEGGGWGTRPSSTHRLSRVARAHRSPRPDITHPLTLPTSSAVTSANSPSTSVALRKGWVARVTLVPPPHRPWFPEAHTRHLITTSVASTPPVREDRGLCPKHSQGRATGLLRNQMGGKRLPSHQVTQKPTTSCCDEFTLCRESSASSFTPTTPALTAFC